MLTEVKQSLYRQNNISSIHIAILDRHTYPHPSPQKNFFFLFRGSMTINIVKRFPYFFRFFFVLYFVIVLQKVIQNLIKNIVFIRQLRYFHGNSCYGQFQFKHQYD